MEHFMTIKKNELMIRATTGMNLKCIVVSEEHQVSDTM